MIKDKRIFITGGNSMMARSLKEILQKDNVVYAVTDYNLITDNIFVPMIDFDTDYVIHLATYSGNLQFNQKYPADTFHNTSLIALKVLKACADAKVKKVLSIISSCAVAEGNGELKEEDLHKGPPNPSIESHGYAKRILDIYSRQLNKQYGLNAICAIVNNSFGPFDSFSPQKTKVIGAMIKRFVDAKEQNLPFVECWGSGVGKREFIYCKDVARLLVLALAKYDDCSIPINIGSPDEITIKQLAEMTAELVGYEGEIKWIGGGDGQLRKKLDLTRMYNLLLEGEKFEYTPFKDALFQTILWYQENRNTWMK